MKQLFIVGAQRSGSTYLYRVLDEHPEIFMAKPIRPEPKFFLNEELYSGGKLYYENKYFSKLSPNVTYCGEKSTSYIESELAAIRFKEYYPEAKILVILRDPVQRALSNYYFSVENGIENLPIEQALLAEEQRLNDSSYSSSVNPYAYKRRGHYMNYLKVYFHHFPREQIKILILEELLEDKGRFNALFKWLGVSEVSTLRSSREIVNSSNRPIEQEASTGLLRSLVEYYEESVKELEMELGRRLHIWRNEWERL